MTDGRRRGQKFMLECCRVLSHWWFDTPLDAHFTTLPMRPKSTIVAPMEGWDRKGDLDVNPRHSGEWPFAVECKDVNGAKGWCELERMFEQPKYPLWAWWDQCTEQAATWKNAHPLLLFTRNRRKTYALARRATIEWLQPRPQKGPILTVTRPSGEVLVMLLLDDLVQTKPLRRSRRRPSRGRLRKSSG